MANKKNLLVFMVLVLLPQLIIAAPTNNTSNVFVFSDPRGTIGQDIDKLCVIANNKVKFYTPNRIMTWGEVERYQFNLPTGYKGAFAGSDNDLCVIVDGKIKSYHYRGDTWQEEKTDFTLPSGFMGVVSGWGDSRLAVILGNKVTFYGHDSGRSNTWKEAVDLKKFDLPSGYKGVCGFILNDTNYLCVTVGGKIKLYFHNNGWEEQYEFSLPSGFTGDVIGFYDDDGFAIVTDGKFKIYGVNSGREIQEKEGGLEFTIPK